MNSARGVHLYKRCGVEIFLRDASPIFSRIHLRATEQVVTEWVEERFKDVTHGSAKFCGTGGTRRPTLKEQTPICLPPALMVFYQNQAWPLRA